jgi:hypothetical protein
MTYNINGNYKLERLRRALLRWFDGASHPNGIILVDARVPIGEVRYVTRFWEELFQGQGMIVKICPGKPAAMCDEQDLESRHALVGGSIMLFRPTSSVKIRQISYDPGKFGIVTKVILNIGLRHSLQWLGVYIPTKSGTGVHSLSKKLEGWYDECRRPKVSKATARMEADPFSGPRWAWSLVTHYVCSFASGGRDGSRLGSIVGGDLNQRWEPDDHDAHSLFSRTAEIGLHYHSGLLMRDHGVPDFNTYRCLGEDGSVIDFMFSDLPRSRWRGGGSPSDVDFDTLSDHLPVYGSWDLPEIEVQFRALLRPAPAIVIFDLSDPIKRDKIITQFSETYTQLRKDLSLKLHATADDPDGVLGTSLECLSYEVSNMARHLADKCCPSYKVRKVERSPNCVSHSIHLQFLARMYKAIWGCSPNQTWSARPTPHSTQKRLASIFRSWEAKVRQLQQSPEPPDEFDGGTGRDWKWWRSKAGSDEFGGTLLQDLSTSSKAVRRSLNADLQAAVRAATRHLNMLAEEDKMKKVIRSALGITSRSPNITVIERPEGFETDPKEIHGHLTSGWQGAFNQDQGVLGVQKGLEPVGSQDDPVPAADKWEAFLDDPEAVVQAFEPTDGSPGVPEELRRKIGEAIGGLAHRHDVQAQMEKVCHAPFSRKEFDRLIDSSKSGSPGLSGLTYQMLKMLPDQGRQDFFTLMHGLWRRREIPEFWTFKGLVGIPKPSCPDVRDHRDLRPIGLIEVSRKLWTRLVAGRIRKVLIDFDVLQPNHCGGLPNKGTDSALLQALNLLEDVIEYDFDTREGDARACQLDFTTWDTTKAFDSVGNHVQYLAWRRIGVPKDVVLWLMRLDMGGVFVLLTPWAKVQLADVTAQREGGAFTSIHAKIRELGFSPQRGFTQGDVKSPLAWILYFDILMTALNRCDPDRYPKARVEGSVVSAVHPFTFIDDLASFTCNRAHTQELACLVSAGHAIFGTKAADTKFRAITTMADRGTITVYDHRWHPTEVPFEDANFLVKVLG